MTYYILFGCVGWDSLKSQEFLPLSKVDITLYFSCGVLAWSGGQGAAGLLG